VFPGYKIVKAVIERHPAMVYANHMAGSHPCPKGTGKNLHTRWRRKRTNATQPEPVALLPGSPPPLGMRPAPPGDT
jgi:hypothetical protein